MPAWRVVRPSLGCESTPAFAAVVATAARPVSSDFVAEARCCSECVVFHDKRGRRYGLALAPSVLLRCALLCSLRFLSFASTPSFDGLGFLLFGTLRWGALRSSELPHQLLDIDLSGMDLVVVPVVMSRRTFPFPGVRSRFGYWCGWHSPSWDFE
ncbi:hypothetical protein A0H81_03798 [Grifola frondosa]|uniref:Uncharacterized protein n=1 Tax=Grifola frondosa TaxID=5627 RepID=A0A1C7MK10_GRIFR|nr:hypothetical protein A0H81_03798 [Grifola frondosa]